MIYPDELVKTHEPMERITNWHWSDLIDEPLPRAIIGYSDISVPEDSLYRALQEIFPEQKPEEICRRGLFNVLSSRDGDIVVEAEVIGSAFGRIAQLAGSREGDSIDKLATNIAEELIAGISKGNAVRAAKLSKFALLQLDGPAVIR